MAFRMYGKNGTSELIDADQLVAAKRLVEQRFPLKRGWTTEWQTTSRRNIFRVRNRNDRVVAAALLLPIDDDEE